MALVSLMVRLTGRVGSVVTNFLPGPSALQTPPSTRGRSRQQTQAVGFQSIDATYNPQWLEMDATSSTQLNWEHPQTAWAALATAIFAFDLVRIIALVPPTAAEAVVVSVIYVMLYASRYTQIENLPQHYRVSFYASVGWTVYALASLMHAMAFSPQHVLPLGVAEALHGGACAIYIGSCAYFYSYHWGRMCRHWMEDRFRPLFALGLASLTLVHGLTLGHIVKILDDPGWWPTIVQIYPDEWQFMADTRLLELYLTAGALLLVILHLRGVFTGTANAIAVFLGTVIVPTVALFGETFILRACAWEHYVMYGPKYW